MMTKLRLKQIVVVEAEMSDHKGRFTRHPIHTLQPILMAGGIHAEHNMRAYLDWCRAFNPDTEWRARIIYHFRSERHLWRWIKRGNTFLKPTSG